VLFVYIDLRAAKLKLSVMSSKVLITSKNKGDKMKLTLTKKQFELLNRFKSKDKMRQECLRHYYITANAIYTTDSYTSCRIELPLDNERVAGCYGYITSNNNEYTFSKLDLQSPDMELYFNKDNHLLQPEVLKIEKTFRSASRCILQLYKLCGICIDAELLIRLAFSKKTTDDYSLYIAKEKPEEKMIILTADNIAVIILPFKFKYDN
jgi:hypothetical protein